MQNAKNEVQTHQLKVEKLIQKSPAEVFQAIGEGRLFLNCGASSEALKIDFKVGGLYALEFRAFDITNRGEFLEIVPNKKVVFTWCQNTKLNPTPDTVVTVDLKEQGSQTLLTLTHSGFTDQERLSDHTGGWNAGLDDLTTEMVQGQLKFNRLFKMPVQKLYDLCKNPATFLGLLGDLKKGSVDFKLGGAFKIPNETHEICGTFTEITPQQKIVFTWETDCHGKPLSGSKVTLSFETEEDDQSWLELLHEGLPTASLQMSHREGWDWLLNRMGK